MPFAVHCCDHLIHNATVVDPGSGIRPQMDIGVYKPNIGDLFEPGAMPGKVCARRIIDAAGMYAVPGLIEGHGHVLPLSFGFDVNDLWKRGITAVCDMGSVSIPSFQRVWREIINRAPCVINAVLCIINTMESTLYYPQFTNLDNEVNKEEIRDFSAAHGDVLMGIKVFLGAEPPHAGAGACGDAHVPEGLRRGGMPHDCPCGQPLRQAAGDHRLLLARRQLYPCV